MISHLLTYGNSIRSTQTVAFVNNMWKTGFSIPAHKLPFYAHTEQLITKSTYTKPICIISGFSGIHISHQKYTRHPSINITTFIICRFLYEYASAIELCAITIQSFMVKNLHNSSPVTSSSIKPKIKILYIKQQSIYVRKKDWIPDSIATSLKRIREL